MILSYFILCQLGFGPFFANDRCLVFGRFHIITSVFALNFSFFTWSFLIEAMMIRAQTLILFVGERWWGSLEYLLLSSNYFAYGKPHSFFPPFIVVVSPSSYCCCLNFFILFLFDYKWGNDESMGIDYFVRAMAK